MLDNIRQDYCRINYHRTSRPESVGIIGILFETIRNAGFRAVLFYRIGRWSRVHKMSFIAMLVERLMHHLCHCWISTVVDIGPGFVVAHVCGIIIDGAAGPIGRNFSIRQNVTIGGNYGKSKNGRTQPIIGDSVSIGPGASILGPITIGSNTIIGANAVVTTDIPENAVVASFRAEVVAQRAEDGSILHVGEKVVLSRKEISNRLKILECKVEDLNKINKQV